MFTYLITYPEIIYIGCVRARVFLFEEFGWSDCEFFNENDCKIAVYVKW